MYFLIGLSIVINCYCSHTVSTNSKKLKYPRWRCRRFWYSCFGSQLYIPLQVLYQTYQVCPLDWAILNHWALLSSQIAKIMCPWMKSFPQEVIIKKMIMNQRFNSWTLKWKLSTLQIKNPKKGPKHQPKYSWKTT